MNQIRAWLGRGAAICGAGAMAQAAADRLAVVGINGFFTLGLWAWAPIWLPELFPTRMWGTAVALTFNAPRLVACIGPLIAGS